MDRWVWFFLEGEDVCHRYVAHQSCSFIPIYGLFKDLAILSAFLGGFRVLNDVLSQERRETESGRAEFPPKPGGIADLEQCLCWHLLVSPQLCKQLPVPK